MTDDSDIPLEEISAEMFSITHMRREEVCARLGIGEDLLEVCLHWEVIHQPEPDSDGILHFPTEAIDRLSRGIRLHRDLGINWPGVSVALELLDRIAELEQQIDSGETFRQTHK